MDAHAVFEIVRHPGTDFIVELNPVDPATLHQALRPETGHVIEGVFVQVIDGKPFSTFSKRDLLVIP